MFDWYPDYEHLCAQIQLILFMVAMGTKLSRHDFLEILRRPRAITVALIVHLFLTPMVALAIIYLGGLGAGIALGLLLTSAMPGGALSKFFTYLAKGNAALSISLSVILTLGTPITVPALLGLLAGEYLPEDFSLPVGRIILEVTAFLLAPLAVGLWIRRTFPRQSAFIARRCIRAGLVVLIVMVVGSLRSGRIELDAYGLDVHLAIILFCVLVQQLSMVPFRVMGWPWKDTVAVGIEGTMRNMNLALLLKASLFPRNDPIANGVLFVLLYYAAVAMVAGFPLALRYRRRGLREDEQSSVVG